MVTIWKYTLEWSVGVQTVGLPSSYGEILDIQIQDGVPVLWVLLDTVAKSSRTITLDVFFTGSPVSTGGWHIATLQEPGTGLVYHFFAE